LAEELTVIDVFFSPKTVRRSIMVYRKVSLIFMVYERFSREITVKTGFYRKRIIMPPLWVNPA